MYKYTSLCSTNASIYTELMIKYISVGAGGIVHIVFIICLIDSIFLTKCLEGTGKTS